MADIHDVIEGCAMYSFEGERGVRNLERLVKIIGDYDSIHDFLVDNSGAIDAIIEWVDNARVDEWQQNITEFCGPDEEETDSDE